MTCKCASQHNGVHFFHIEWQSNRQKVVRTHCALNISTSKCARASKIMPKYNTKSTLQPQTAHTLACGTPISPIVIAVIIAGFLGAKLPQATRTRSQCPTLIFVRFSSTLYHFGHPSSWFKLSFRHIYGTGQQEDI